MRDANSHPSPLWGRGWLASGVLISRGETGEGVKTVTPAPNSDRGTKRFGAQAFLLLCLALFLRLERTVSRLVRTPSPPALRSPLSPKAGEGGTSFRKGARTGNIVWN
jgi:hypothetical protein